MKKIDFEKGKKIGIPYQVEQAYFDQLTVEIQKRIQKPPRSGFILQNWVWRPVVAAAILILGYIIFIPGQPQDPEMMLAELPEQELLAYLDLTDANDLELAFVIDDQSEILDENTLPDEFSMEDLESVEYLFEEFDTINQE